MRYKIKMKSDLKCTRKFKKRKHSSRNIKKLSLCFCLNMQLCFCPSLWETFRDITCVLCTVTISKKIVRTVQISRHCFIFVFFCCFFPHILQTKKTNHWGRRFFIKLHGLGLCTNVSTFIHKLDEVGGMQRENISRMQEIPWEKKKETGFEDTYQEQNTLSLQQSKLCAVTASIWC